MSSFASPPSSPKKDKESKKKSEKQAEFIDGDDQLGAGNDPEKKSRKTHGRRKSPDENDGEAEARNGEDNDADQNDGKKRSKLKKLYSVISIFSYFTSKAVSEVRGSNFIKMIWA